MSRSSSSSSSVSSSALPSILPDPNELSDLILDDPMVELLNQTFSDDFTAAAHLRHYSFISLSLKRLQTEINRHYEEQQELFEHMMNNEDFRDKLQPIVRARRRRINANHPHHRRSVSPHVLTPLPPPSYSPSTSQPSTIDGLPNVNPHQLGSSQNPIEIESDSEDDQYEIFARTYRREFSPRFRPTCERCGLIGHNTADCDTPLRTFAHCSLCEWLGKKQRLCEHVDMSPAAFKRLRGNTPYDAEDV
jgi:hypothetical protein